MRSLKIYFFVVFFFFFSSAITLAETPFYDDGGKIKIFPLSSNYELEERAQSYFHNKKRWDWQTATFHDNAFSFFYNVKKEILLVPYYAGIKGQALQRDQLIRFIIFQKDKYGDWHPGHWMPQVKNKIVRLIGEPARVAFFEAGY